MEGLLKWLLSTVSAAAVVAVVVFIFRHRITEWIGRSIQHSYDARLEELRAANERELKRVSSALDAQQGLVSAAFLEARRAANERRLSAIQMLWDEMIRLYFAAAPCVAMTDLLPTEYYREFFERTASKVPSFADIAAAIKAQSKDVEKARLLAGEYLYAIFFAYRAFIGGIELHLVMGGEKGTFEPWWEYDHILDLLRPVLTEDEWNEFQAQRIKKYSFVVGKLEGKFLLVANEIIDGRRAAADAFEQAREILSAARSAMEQPPQELKA